MSKGRILLVDDDKTLLRLMREALTKADYEVMTASNGIDGLQELYAKQPDLMILDVMMPRQNGFGFPPMAFANSATLGHWRSTENSGGQNGRRQTGSLRSACRRNVNRHRAAAPAARVFIQWTHLV